MCNRLPFFFVIVSVCELIMLWENEIQIVHKTVVDGTFIHMMPPALCVCVSNSNIFFLVH